MNKYFLILLLISGCAYSSSFTCSDAKGYMCKSMDRVYKMIDSGQIAEIECEGCEHAK